MKFFIVIMLLFLSLNTQAILSCSKNGTTVVYTNGVTTTRLKAQSALDQIIELGISAKIDIKETKVKYQLAYNFQESTAKDFIEASVERFPKEFLESIKATDKYAAYEAFLSGAMSDPSYTNELNSISEKIVELIADYLKDYFNDPQYLQTVKDIKSHYDKALKNGERVYAISHSQGGLLMRDAYSAIQNLEKDKYFSGFQIASPLNKLPLGHFDYATHDKDRLINTLRFLLGALESNLDTPLVVNNAYESFGDYVIDFVLNHGITSTYLYDSDIKPQVIKKMISTGQLLESNCANSIINYTKTALKVSFDSTDPSDPSISGLTYIWDFGDDVIKKTQEKTINHLYAEPGTYTVKLKVLDEYGNVFVSERNVTVKLPYVLSPLFEINKSNKTAEFTATNYYEEVSYVWSFGDGQVEEAIGQTITHSYAEEGIYDVTLTVVAPNGNQKSLTKKMIIADERIYDYKRLGQYADFKVRPAFDLSGTGLFFQWEFGEGQTLKTQDLNVQHIYSDLFGKSVTLKIVNEFDKVIYKNNVQLDDQSNTELFTYKLSGRDISIEIFSQYSVSGTQNYYFWNFDNGTTLLSHEQKIDFSFPDLLAKDYSAN